MSALTDITGRTRARLVRRVFNVQHRVPEAELTAAVAGKVVLVTGASHGIGRATAERLAGAGAHVLAVARSQDALDELVATTGGAVRAFPVDLTDPAAIDALVPALLAEHGHIDVVVSNAGRSIRRSIADSTDRMHDFTRTMAINYMGPVQLLLGLLPEMRRRGTGHVVNVSTIGVLLPPAPRWAAYLASKTAFDAWMRSAAAEMADDGVTATSIYMGLVHTRMSAPTGDFNGMPGLSPAGAADILCHAIVRRPVMVAPWWARAAGVFDDLARGRSEAFVRRYGRQGGGGRT